MSKKSGPENKNSSHSKETDPRHASVSPLQRIKEKELELRGKYMEAKKKSELIVAEARKNASEIRRTATEKASKEAKAYFDKKAAELRVEKVKSSEEEISQLKIIAEKNFEKSCDFLYRQIVTE